MLMLTVLTLSAWFLNICLGSVSIPLKEVMAVLFSADAGNETWKYIVLEYRLPKAMTSALAGSGLAVSGMLMQTLFRNPLAGPYVLGLSSGASLGVALVIMGAGLFSGVAGAGFLSDWSLVIASSAGSLLVLLAVLITSVRLKDTMAILIIGLMFSSLTSAVVSVLAYFSPASQLQQYVFWSYGSVGDLTWEELAILSSFWILGIGLSLGSSKGLNTLLLGEQYARSLGMKVSRNRLVLLVATSLLAGSITAFTGPIAFIGLAVPHLVRQVLPVNDHRLLLPSVMLGGALLMLICDTIAQLPGSVFTLPINAITSLVGAPVVIWLLVRRKKFQF